MLKSADFSNYSVEICCLSLKEKDKDMLLPRLSRSCKKQDDLSLKVNTSVHSKLRKKSSTGKKKNQLLQKSKHTFEESFTESQKFSKTSTPTIPCYVKLSKINPKNIPDKMSGSKKRGRKKKNTVNQVVLFGSENENTQSISKVSRNLRSRCSTPLKETSKNLKGNGTKQRQLHSCRQSANHSTNSVSIKRGRKPLICKKNIMEQDKCEENLEESFFQNENFNGTSHGVPVTSTPLIPYQKKTKKFKILNTPNQSVPKSTSTKRKGRTINDFSFERPNKTAGSSRCDSIQRRQYSRSAKDTCSNLGAQIMKDAKHSQKSSTKGRKGKHLNLERQTFCNEFPVDDLSLGKTVQAKRKVKSDGFKVPRKNTLKRKRFVYNEFHKANEGYEDDIYESQEFNCFKEILQDTTFSDVSSSMPTPKFGLSLTPRILPKTPLFKDCISPEEYAITKKIAEECLYRNKKKKNVSHEETAVVPERKKLEFNEALENIQMQEKGIKLLMEEARSDKEDSYLSD